MPEQVHGHEVMRMMINDGRVFTKATLRAAIVARFGESTRFYTCSAENMTSDELVLFLEGRSKFIHEGDGFRTEADKICKD
jgi:probable metal-binding protein